VKVIDFIFAARPMLLLPVWSIYLITYNLASPDSSVDYLGLLRLVSLTLIFAGTYYINQIYDYDSDLINKKLGFLQMGMISGSGMTAVYISSTVLALAAGFYVGVMFGIIICLIFLLGFFYSAPPVRLKDRPVGGLLANTIAYGALVPGAAEIHDFAYGDDQLLIIAYFSLLVGAGYLMTIIPDRDGDKKTGKLTLAVYMSDRKIILAALILLIIAFYPAYLIENRFLIGIDAVSIIFFGIALIYPKEALILFACKFPILLVSLLAGYNHPTYLVFIVVLLSLTRLYYKKRFDMNYPRIN